MNKLKKFIEKRSALMAELDAMVEALDNGKELREFTVDEKAVYDAKKAEMNALTDTIKSIQETRSEEISLSVSESRSAAENEERAFENYLRHQAPMEVRTETNWTVAANGAVIPASIANKIIDKVHDISPLYSLATHYNVGGTLSIPYYEEQGVSGTLSVGYADEFSELEGSSASFKSITLSGYLAGALTKISKSLINNSNFPIVDYVINKLANVIAKWIDTQLIWGDDNKIEGLKGVKQSITSQTNLAITADELIDLQEKIPDLYQPDCCWIMSKEIRTAIRKLKDGEGNYILNKDATSKWGYTLFGKPVYVAECMPDFGPDTVGIYYGDFSGLAVKMSEGISIQLLLEKYATQHAVGVVAWFEMDAKVENTQKIAKLKFPA